MNATPTPSSPPQPTEVQHLSQGMRAGYGLLGIVLIAFAGILLASPFIHGYVFAATLWLFAVLALLAMGISDIVASTSQPEAPEGLRMLRLLLGVLVIIFAFVAALSFSFALLVIWIFIGLGLLFQAIFLLAGVGGSNQLPEWQRGFGVGLGVVELVLAFLVLLFPVFAFTLAWILISISAITVAIYLLGVASTGVKKPLPVMMGMPGFANPPMGGTPGAPPPSSPK